MRRIQSVLIVGIIVTMLGAPHVQSQSEGDGTTAPSPASPPSPAPGGAVPPATAPPPPTPEQSPPAAAAPTSPASDRELTAVLVSTSANTSVLKKWDSTEISFHVADPSLLPKNLRAGTYTFFCRVHPFMRGAFRVRKR